MGGRGEDENHGGCEENRRQRWRGLEDDLGGVRLPERVLWSEVRKWEEVSSGEVGNWEGRTRGVPKTASAGERLVRS